MDTDFDRIVRFKEATVATGYTRSGLNKKIAAGQFPAPFSLGKGARAVGWRRSTIEQWLREQQDASTAA